MTTPYSLLKFMDAIPQIRYKPEIFRTLRKETASGNKPAILQVQ